MPFPLTGTRNPTQTRSQHPPATLYDRGFTADKGMSKIFAGSATFTTGATQQITAASNSFNAFAVEDIILVEGTNLNNGPRSITAIDTVNHAFLTVDLPCKAEGPVVAKIRAFL